MDSSGVQTREYDAIVLGRLASPYCNVIGTKSNHMRCSKIAVCVVLNGEQEGQPLVASQPCAPFHGRIHT